MKVLSLFDGMSCCHIALDKVGIKVDEYYASEIKPIAIKVTQENYPETIQIGDVNKVSYKDGVLYTENGDFNVGHIDLLAFGSPCSSFSISMKTDMRIGLEDKMRSGLFLEAYRILKEVQPTYFFLENVKSMKNEDRDFITKCMGVVPIMIDGALVGPAYRRRYYWTNIPNVTQPKDKGITLQSILTDGYTDRQKARNLLVSDSRPLTTPVKIFYRYYSTGFTTVIFKDEQHYKDCVAEYERIAGEKRKVTAKELDNYDGHIFDGVRYLNQEEIEKCHCVPQGYTKCLTRNQAADVVGDGWQIDVIAHMFRNIPTGQNDLKLRGVC